MVQFNVPNCFSGDCDCAGTPPPSSFCPYGDCFTCVPSECSGPQCCCCASIDIVLGIRAECYDRVFFSCNSDGTSPGPGVDPFLPACTQCFDACDRALGGAAACASISQHVDDPAWQPSPADWYNFSIDIGPCDCNCESLVDPNNPGAGCNLTCVTCSGLRCNANVEVISANCGYQFNLTPSTGCCGTPALTDAVFAIDYSGSMDNTIDSVIASAGDFADGLALTGGQARFGLLIYGKTSNCAIQDSDIVRFTNGQILTTDPEEFKQAMVAALPTAGGAEPDFRAAGVALQTYPWQGVENLLFVIGDEPIDNNCGSPTGDLSSTGDAEQHPQPSAASLIDLANTLGVSVFTVQPSSGGIGADTRKTELSINTSGGQDLDIAVDFGTLVDDLNLNVFGSSCECLDSTPIPVELCRGGTGSEGNDCIDPDVNVPIGICVEENNSDCGICNEALAFSVCGEIVVVEPDPETINLVCCGELGAGCACPTDEFPEEGCCGVICDAIDVCPPNYGNLQAAIDGVWCECWGKANLGIFVLETPNCTRCTIPNPDDPDYGDFDISALENCVIKVPDGIGGFNSITRSQIAAEVTEAWRACEDPMVVIPPSISESSCTPECDREDKFIGSSTGCTSVRNPDTAILNNGIGLVAYESMENVSVIKIEQFNTSVPAKILPNRRTNYGRLQHTSRWEETAGDFKLVKLYYFESLPTHFINGLAGPPQTDSLVDMIIFQNGPLQNQCFSLDENPIGPVETEVDEIGNFIRFTVPSDTVLSNEFPSLDDVYNIEWFIIDSDDTGLTGSVITSADVPGADFLLNRDGDGENAVNIKLELTPHIHDGKPAPIANPSIATAHNYMNAIENSHYIYLVYQALEDQKWNLYMRQLRLSEYSREEILANASAGTVALQTLGITELVYRAVCVTDKCEVFGNNFLVKRTVTFEVTLQDGREVFNEALLSSTESWPVCPGEPAGSFLKKKVVVDFTHSTITNRCPDQFESNEIFYNWEVGDEFSIPFTELKANDLFVLFKKPNDNVAPLGETTIQIAGITIESSQVSIVWYEDIAISLWVVSDNATFQDLLQYKGLDISVPIPITEFEDGHCTHPVVAVNANNEVFVVYECTDPQVHQIHITGTTAPSTSFPLGIFSPKNLDANLDYFLSPKDFTYRNSITLSGESINQLPDMFIDPNDVIRVAWQSNRDNYWEIYYSNSEEQFKPKRITDFKSKSLKPSITGDKLGNIHIVWHDNRFGNWEIMMAYRADERALTLLEQDPYLAGIRNPGYSHSTDVIPLTMQNSSSTNALCISNLFVRFFTDRLLTQPAFDVLQETFPMAFQIPGAQDDRSTIDLVYADLVEFIPDGESPINRFVSPVIDTLLVGSEYESITVIFDTITPIDFTFQAGESPDLLDPSWDVGGVKRKSFDFVSGEKIPLDIIQTSFSSIGPTKGRYKRIMVGLNTGDDLTSISKITIVSVERNRFCIAPKDTITGFLDVTPFIRVDKKGNETVETPVPVGINKNQTYFIAVVGIQDNGQLLVFDEQKRSVSCETCVNDTSPWDSASCTYSVSFLNVFSEQEIKFVNARIRFYADQELSSLVAQFDAFSDGDLECFTTDDNQPAQNVWTEQGLEIFFGKSRTITLWPMLSNTSGLLCGVTYWVTTETCTGNADNPCSRLSLTQIRLESWTCNCGSPRWEERFGDAPVNIRDVVRWVSSGDGFSDTRLTETGSSVNNYNPIIRLRTDLTGIVVYESNRDDPNRLIAENEKHTLYGTAFSVFPSSKMYATSAESINTKFGEVLIRSDVPISACNPPDCEDSEIAIEGRNTNFEFDQYDNIFLAAERFADQTDCVELRENNQRRITVHRCGIQAKNLAFASEELEGAGTFTCNASEILGKTAPLSQDKIFKQLIKLVRVNNEFAKYHIVRAKKPSAVVDQCSIDLDIITEPSTIAVRLKNESETWSTWFPFDPEIGENTIRIPWVLTAVSGVKTVTVEAATYQGLSASFSLPIVADYKGVDHTVKFYRLTTPNAPVPSPEDTFGNLLDILETNDTVFAPENLLQNLEGVPVAGIRQPSLLAGTLVKNSVEFIFVEITPSIEYLEKLGILGLTKENQEKFLPTFDVLQQGAQDLFSVPTKFDEAKKVFKGVFSIQKEDETFFKDGLSFVVPNFQQDCGDLPTALLSTDEYTRDQFNIVVPGLRTTSLETNSDVWAGERDEVGKIKSQIDIRGTEDPYFVFGDPNYRLKKQDE